MRGKGGGSGEFWKIMRGNYRWGELDQLMGLKDRIPVFYVLLCIVCWTSEQLQVGEGGEEKTLWNLKWKNCNFIIFYRRRLLN